MSKDELRKEIVEKVKQYYRQKKETQFVPGQSMVNYAGRVYDEEEMALLVDASLDFWLTTGRYAKQFEAEFAEFLGMKHCLLTNSGSSANLLAMSALTSPKLGKEGSIPGMKSLPLHVAFPRLLTPSSRTVSFQSS